MESKSPVGADGESGAFPLCPNCRSGRLEVFYTVRDIPVHSVLLVKTRERALDFETGHISLGYCGACGFISNTAFDLGKLNYSEEYEETQGYSPTFGKFHDELADDLIKRHHLRNKSIIEIGCGKGEFLALLCEKGPNDGIGFDPAYVDSRNLSAARDRMNVIQDFYSEKYSELKADFVCCKMTLEHIPETARFVEMVYNALKSNRNTTVFFQVPEASRILSDLAFWDIYYEHCSYFHEPSLEHLFSHRGFDVINTWKGYRDQYLMIEARVCRDEDSTISGSDAAMDLHTESVNHFRNNIENRLAAWRHSLAAMHSGGRRVVLWGGGSKAVAFLSTLRVDKEIGGVVDINPYRQGSFLAGTGHQIIGPAELSALDPDTVILMNPVYFNEVRATLNGLGVAPDLISVDADPNEYLTGDYFPGKI